MEQSPFVSPLLILVQKLETTVIQWHKRGDLKEDNKSQLLRLKQQYAVAARILRRVAQVCSPDFVTLEILALHESNLQQDMDRLTMLGSYIENAKRTDRLKRMKEILDQCGATVKEFLEFAADKIAPMLQYNPWQSQAQPSRQDVYVPFFAAPVNPPRLILQYNTNNTSEGKLKDAVLKETDSQVVGVVASGKGGVGKTCALRGLARDAEVRERFSGGIFFIELGKDAAISTIIGAISTLVERTGGRNTSMAIEAAKSLQVAADKASVWFNSQSCLCLVDDIWRVNGIDRDVLTILGSMMNVNSRLVYTTRDTHFLSRADEVIEFTEKDPCGELSRKMLMRHGGFSEDTQLDEKNKGAFEGILRTCQGLPLAFGIAGGSVLEISRWKGEHEKEDAWSDFHSDACLNPDVVIEGSAEQYGRLSKIVDVSLQVLERQHVYEEYSKWFRAFCVLEKQQSVPDHMLQKLWSMEKLESARRAVRKFAQVSLVQVERRSSANGSTMFVHLHDLVLDLAVRKALEKSERKGVFQTLYRNYIPGRERSDVGHEWWKLADDGYIYDNVCRILRGAGHANEVLRLLSKPQWIAERLVSGGIFSVEQDVRCGEAIADDRIYGDVNRKEHLEQVRKAARRSYRIVANNPREVWFQLHGRLLSHATKCELTKRFVEEIEACAPRPWVKGSLGLLQPPGALVEVIESVGTVRCISDEEGEVWFLWCGELATNNDMGVTCYKIATGVCKTQRFEHNDLGRVRCWAFLRDRNSVATGHSKGNTGLKVVIWNRETGHRKQIVNFADSICRVDYFIGDGTRVKCGAITDAGADAPRHQHDSPQVVQVWDTLSGERITPPLVGHSGDVRCVAMSADGKRMVSGAEDKTVRVWDVHNGGALTMPLVGHAEVVLSVAVSADGKRIVSGSRDQNVRVWDAHSGDALLPPLVGHNACVLCVAVSADGKRIVSGSVDKTIRVWDVQSGAALTPPLVGHTDVVCCMAVSADGKRIVSGSPDKTVRVWDAHGGEAFAPPTVEHTGDVLCVAVSADGTRMVSGSEDKTVRVWNAYCGEALTPPFVGHTDDVLCVALSADGQRIVSGSRDDTVRVWDALCGEALTPPLVGHTSWVECVVITPDGKRIVSGSRDETVRVWHMHSGEALLPPFVGHTGSVGCVALSADGARIVSGSEDKTVRVWDAHSGDALTPPLVGHNDVVCCVAMSSDGTRVVSASWDRTVRVWDALGGGTVGMPLLHERAVTSVGVDAHCSKIVSFDSFGTGRLWDVGGGECMLTSQDVAWYSTVGALVLSWVFASDSFAGDRQVRDGEMVLATCDEPVRQVGLGELYVSHRFGKNCRIMR